MEQAKKILEKSLGPRLRLVQPLANYTVLGVGGPADFFFEATSQDDLVKSTASATEAKIPFFILGGGSAILISDVGFHGLVVRNLFEGIQELPGDSPNRILLEIGSGTSLAKLVRFATEAGYSGLEWLAGLPGTVGGAVVTNVSGISKSLESVRVRDVVGQLRTLPREDCQLQTGRSRFLGRSEVILSAKFSLHQTNTALVTDAAHAVLTGRDAHVPHSLRMFADVDGESPRRLINAVGLSGYRVGGSEVSTEDANILRNLGHATSENVLEVISTVKNKVKEKYYVELTEDFIFIGPQ